MGPFPREIQEYYLRSQETGRLSSPQGELERLRTQAILARHLPAPPAIVFDIGGAAGVHAFPLAKSGYQVNLIDPMELHLEQARAHATASGLTLASIAPGDARKLDVPSGIADAVLLLGPLYHLTDTLNRLQALREARRILKPRGVLFAAAISRFASLIDGLSSGFFEDAQEFFCAGEQRRPRGVEQLVADDVDSLVADGRDLSPRFHFVGLMRFGSIACGRPGEHDQLRRRGCDLFIGYFLAGRQDHLASTDLDDLSDPGWGTDPRVRPCFAINAELLFSASGLLGDRGKTLTHVFDQAFSVWSAVRNAAQSTNIVSNVSERPWIGGQEGERVLQKFSESFLLVGNRADDERGFQL